MSPAPAINDPGNDSDRDEVHSADVPAANLMAVVDSSSEEDELEENVISGIGYQLLAPGLEFLGPAGPDDSDDEDDCDAEEDDDGDNNHLQVDAQLEGISEDEVDTEQVNNTTHPKPHLQVPPLAENQELKELQELWKTPRMDSEVTVMNQDQVDAVKSAMAGFSLPPSSLPEWANQVPEADWKAQLLSHLSFGKTSTKLTDSKSKKSVVHTHPSQIHSTNEDGTNLKNSETRL